MPPPSGKAAVFGPGAPAVAKTGAPVPAGKPPLAAPPSSLDVFSDIPDDIFASPTKVGPPPASPPGGSANLADQIDLDSDMPLPPIPGPPAPPPAAARPPAFPPLPTSAQSKAPGARAPVVPPPRTDIPKGKPVPAAGPPAISKPPAPAVPPLPAAPTPVSAAPGGSDDLFSDLPPVIGTQAAAGSLAFLDPFADLAPAPSTAGPAADPFGGGQDVFGGPPVPPAPPKPPAAPAPPAAAGDDLFGDLGDPFAGLPAKASPPPLAAPAAGDDLFPGAPPPSAPPPAVPAPVPPAGPGAGDDPFAALDAGPWTGGPPAGQDTVGHDPFAGGPDGGPEAGMDAGMDLALDTDGKLTGRPPPPAPPPVRTAAPKPAETAAVRPAPVAPPPMQPSVIEVPAKAAIGYKVAFAVLSLVVILLLFLIYRSGGKPDLTRWSTYVEAFTGKAPEDAPAGAIQAVGVTHTLFANRHGYPLLVAWGDIENSSRESVRRLVVKAQVMSRDRRILAEATLPAGVMFSPIDLLAMENQDAVVQAYRSRLSEAAGRELAPAQRLPFMAVLYSHPEDLKDAFLRVEAAAGADDNLGLPPAPPPPPETPPPVEPAPPPKKGPRAPAPTPAPARPAGPPASP